MMTLYQLLPLLALGGCVSIENVTLAPVPCDYRFLPVKTLDLWPRQITSDHNGVCVRAQMRETTK